MLDVINRDEMNKLQNDLYKVSERQLEFRFANGYGASVINDGYGSQEGLFEIAVLKQSGKEWCLTYETPITDDVLGWQSRKEVLAVLRAIKAL